MKNIILVMITLFGLSSYAQIQKGKVLDSDGNPVENAYLVNTNSESHAHTNEFGLFSLDKTVLGDVIKITALGYKKSNFTIVS